MATGKAVITTLWSLRVNILQQKRQKWLVQFKRLVKSFCGQKIDAGRNLKGNILWKNYFNSQLESISLGGHYQFKNSNGKMAFCFGPLVSENVTFSEPVRLEGKLTPLYKITQLIFSLSVPGFNYRWCCICCTLQFTYLKLKLKVIDLIMLHQYFV